MTFHQIVKRVAYEAAKSRSRPDLEQDCREFLLTLSEKYDPRRDMYTVFRVFANNYVDIRIFGGTPAP